MQCEKYFANLLKELIFWLCFVRPRERYWCFRRVSSHITWCISIVQKYMKTCKCKLIVPPKICQYLFVLCGIQCWNHLFFCMPIEFWFNPGGPTFTFVKRTSEVTRMRKQQLELEASIVNLKLSKFELN